MGFNELRLMWAFCARSMLFTGSSPVPGEDAGLKAGVANWEKGVER